MKSRKIRAIITAAAFLLSAALTAWTESSAAELTILYTANSSGKMMFCDCPNDPYGGLVERVTFISDFRRKHDDFLLLDAGNMVGLFGDYDLKAATVLDIMNLMDYDAALAGRNEFYRGTARALKMQDHADFPLLNANVMRESGNTAVFKPWTLKNTVGVSVAIAALVDSSSFQHVRKDLIDFRLASAEKHLNAIMPEMKNDTDVIVLLSQMAHEANIRIMESFPDIDLIIEGFGNKTYDPPIAAGSGVIVSPGTYGNHVGLITLETDSGKTRVKNAELLPVLNIPADKKAEKKVLQYYKKRK